MSVNLHTAQPIAIVGVSALFPGSSDATGFWRDILAGRDLIGDVPATHWRVDDYYDPDPAAPDKTYARRGGFLSPVDFDALGWGVPPSTLPATDTSQLLALIVAQAVLKDAAREQFETMDRSRISVILGVTSAQELLFSMVSRLQKPVWVKALREAGMAEDEVQDACARIAAHYVPWQEASFPGLLGNVVAGRIANRLNLGGTNCVTDAACASSLSALAMAVAELQLGHSDLAIAGGVDTLNDIFMYMCFSKTPALSPSGDCRPFSDQADGTMLGEGLGMVALKRLADAERDGDRIYAVLRGVGTASDGRSKSVYAPVSAGQAQALRRAYAAAGYGPETVELVEAHGTGTKAGDIAEFEGLRSVYAPAGGGLRNWCALGSVKSQIGHTKAAAGAAGLFKAVMALHHKVLPPTIKVERPDPRLDIDSSPFYLNTRARPWIRASDHPRRAAVSAFGFGGSNFHVTLEEYSGSAPRAERLATQSCELVLLQAGSVAELIAKAEAMLQIGSPLANLAHASRQDWDANSPRRLALVAADAAQLNERLRAAITRLRSAPDAAFALPDGSSYGFGPVAGKLALLFPGQGSQYLEMGAALAMQFDAARSVWDRAADALKPQHQPSWEWVHPAIGFSDELPEFEAPLSRGKPAPTTADLTSAKDVNRHLHDVVFPRPPFNPDEAAANRANLTATEWAQPALAAHSMSLLALLRELGIDADMCAGHSFGELMALHAAGVLDADEGLRLARARGEAMRDAARHPGAMTALSEPIERVRQLLAEHADVVIANHNGPCQVVVSGPLQAISNFEALIDAERIVYTRLPVASAFHSSIVAEASIAFAQALTPTVLAPARIPVYGNTDAAVYPDDADGVRQQLAQQLARPVRFVEMIEAMYADGARLFVEVGAGQVLTGLVGTILGAREHSAIGLDRKGRDGVETLLVGLSRLAALGVPMQPQRLFADVRLAPAVAATPKHAIAISGSNVGKPYPPVDGSALPGPNPPREWDLDVDRRSRCEHSELRDAFTHPSGSPLRGQPDLPPTEAFATPGSDSMPASREIPADWLIAFQDMQAQTAAAHESFQRAMADSHAAYLKLAETALGGLTALLHDVPASTGSAAPMRAASDSAPVALAPVAAALPPVGAGLPREPLIGPGNDRGINPLPQDRDAHIAATNTFDLPALLLAIVADKTGYPVDMLNLDMDLEGDLGIDSIKRVEILAAVDERAPELPKVDRARLGAMRTLAEIVAALGAASSVGAGLSREPAIGPGKDRGINPLPHGREAPIAAAPAIDLPALLLAVVADKTGYPVDMLKLDMDLEGDLGIDSIKRVEILAAVDERAPDLPKVDRARLGAMRTLAEIVDALGAASPVGAGLSREPSIGPGKDRGINPLPQGRDANIALAPAVDLSALLLAVVADKTGYPVDMLKLDMDLEGDLGIDSIKRVEILAAVDERAPALPKVDRARLGAMRTLAEIVAALGAASPVGAGLSREPSIGPGKDRGINPLPQGRDHVVPDAALARFELDLIPAPATGLAMPGLLGGAPLWIVGHETIGEALASELQRRGVRAQSVDVEPEGADACVFLGGLRDFADIATATALNFEAFSVARQLAPRLQSSPGLFVTVQDTGGAFGLSAMPAIRAWAAGLPALVKTCALEWPQAALKAIDIEHGDRDAAALAAAIADELLTGGGEIEVALTANGERRTLRSVARPAQADVPVIEADDVVVVSGGARGVTAACLIEWAQRCPARFVLLGRTPLDEEPPACAGIQTETDLKRALLADARAHDIMLTPAQLAARANQVLAAREIRQTLAAIIVAGGSAQYRAVAVDDAAALAAVLADVRAKCGPIRAVVHAAGVLADKRIAEKTDAQFAHVFDTKVAGLRALLDATRDDPLKLLVVFSSVSARCGNTGQADYAMANEVLAKVAAAEQRRRPRLRVKSLGWGPWEGGMVSPALRERFASLGVPMIPLAVGARMFADELTDAGALELVLGGEPRPQALLSAGADARVEALELRVDQASHAWLAGHAVAGMPVVPVVLVAEWLARAVRSWRPGLHLTALHDLKVLKGIRLGGFGNGGDRLRIEARPLGAGELALSVIGSRGELHYSARAELGREPASAPQGLPELPLDDWSGGPLYQDLLFHRGQFELIDQIDGISDAGISAQLRGVAAAEWPGDVWQLDAAALDGGLQMAVLYGQRMLGGANLPTAIGELRSHAAPGPGPINAVAYSRRVGPAVTTTDILYTDASGRRFAEMIGVQNHALPQ